MPRPVLRAAAKALEKAGTCFLPKAPAPLKLLAASPQPLLIGPGGPVKASKAFLPMVWTPLAKDIIPYAGKPVSSFKFAGAAPPMVPPKYDWTYGNDDPPDASGCIAKLVSSVMSAAVGIYESAKAEAEDANNKKLRAALTAQLEKEVQGAIKDFTECLKKGKSYDAGLTSALGDTALGQISSTVTGKLFQQDAKKMKSSVKRVGDALEKDVEAFQKEHKKALNQRKTVVSAFDMFVGAFYEALADYNRAHIQLRDAAKQTTKDYLKAVSETKGLTTANPSAVKALEALEKSKADERLVQQVNTLRQTATQALTDHYNSVSNANQGNAEAAAFENALKALIAKI